MLNLFFQLRNFLCPVFISLTLKVSTSYCVERSKKQYNRSLSARVVLLKAEIVQQHYRVLLYFLSSEITFKTKRQTPKKSEPITLHILHIFYFWTILLSLFFPPSFLSFLLSFSLMHKDKHPSYLYGDGDSLSVNCFKYILYLQNNPVSMVT